MIINGIELTGFIRLDVLLLRALYLTLSLIWNDIAIENTGNLINVAAKAIFLKEISKWFIIHHPSNTIKESIPFITVYIIRCR